MCWVHYLSLILCLFMHCMRLTFTRILYYFLSFILILPIRRIGFIERMGTDKINRIYRIYTNNFNYWIVLSCLRLLHMHRTYSVRFILRNRIQFLNSISSTKSETGPNNEYVVIDLSHICSRKCVPATMRARDMLHMNDADVFHPIVFGIVTFVLF